MQMGKPLPQPTPDTAPFWEATKQHELKMQYCADCSRFYYYPRMYCRYCMGSNIEWRQLSGRGKLHTYVINHRPPPGRDPEQPYVIAIVELDEGPRMMTNIVIENPTPDKLPIDAAVEVVWDDVNDDITLPLFRLV